MKKTNQILIALAWCLGVACAFAQAVPAGAGSPRVPEATTYQIRNLKHQELLRPRDANNANGTPIVLYPAQPWKCMTWRLQPAGASAFHLKNLFTSKTFCADSDTNQIRQTVFQIPLAKAGAESPAWQFTQLAGGNYEITDLKSGKALTSVKGADNDSIKIVIEPWRNLDEQKWILEKIDPAQLTM